MTSLFAMIQKEIRHLSRDRRTVALVTFMPIIQLLIYGFAIDVDVRHLHTALHDEDQTALSRRLVSAFEQSAYFDIKKRVWTPAELREVLDRGTVKACLHIPPNFAKDLSAGRQARVQLLIDGTDSTPANAALNTSQVIVTHFLEREGLVPIRVLPIDFRPRMWYNPDLKSAFFFVPGLMGFLIMILIPMMTASAIVREKENGNIEQLLVTPIRPWEIMVGKIVPYVGIGLIIATTILAGARLIFQVPIRGNVFTLFILTLLFLTVYLGLGLFASTVASTQQQATQVLMAFIAPSVLLSGFIFPRESMPLPIYWLGNFIPLTYYLKIVRGIILKGLGFWELRDQIVPLAAMAVFMLFFSIRKFHKRLS
jgi:ABC-2 type transport system permease protein